MNNRIPFLDLRRRWSRLGDETLQVTRDVLHSGTVLLGPQLEAFEAEFATFTGYEYVVGVASGTEALRLVLASLGVGVGDEVIVPAFTAVPTAAAVCAVGATPVFADVEPDTATLDPKAAEQALTKRTKAVIPVHLYGRPANLPELGVPIIEDAAQAHGALHTNTKSVATIYSFYPTKNLGGIGDGGTVVTHDAALANDIRSRRAHGVQHNYVHDTIATNARMSEAEAAALRVGLRYLPWANARRVEIAQRYRQAAPDLDWQQPHPDHVLHLCVALFDDREEFRQAAPFETGVHYPLALTQQPAYQQFSTHACPNAENWAARCVSLPCYPEMTEGEINSVAAALEEWHAGTESN